MHGSLIETDIPCKVYILHINEKLPPAERFVIQDLDETHLLVRKDCVQFIQERLGELQAAHSFARFDHSAIGGGTAADNRRQPPAK